MAATVFAPGGSEDVGSNGGLAAGLVATGGAGTCWASSAEPACWQQRPSRSRTGFSDAAFDVSHCLEQSLVTLFGRSLAINLEQFSEVAHQSRIGQKPGPIRTCTGILRVSHKMDTIARKLS